MTESRDSDIGLTTAATERRAVESPQYDAGRNRSTSILVWVGIVAGVVFIVAVIFFAGVFIGRNSHGHFRGGYHQPGMMGPAQSGQYGPMWPGMMGPGGMTGPFQQPPITTPSATPRP